MRRLSEAEALLRGAVADGLATGWQLSVASATCRTDAAGGVDGLGREVDAASRFTVYCAVKPLLATAVAAAVDDGALSWDDRLADLLDGVGGELGRCTVRSLLDHSSGARVPDAVTATALPPAKRVPVAARARPVALEAGASAYSEAAAWILAGAALAAAVGTDVPAFTGRRVLGPLGLTGDVDLGDAPCDDGRLRLNVSVRRSRRWPVLLERTASLGWATNPGYGGRVAVRALVALALETMEAAAGRGRVLSVEAGRELLRPGPATYDSVWQRHCRFGAGWLVGLRHHRFGPSASAGSFGHAGLLGMTAVWAEPSAGVAAGYHLNGLSDGATTIDWLRAAMVTALRRAVAADDR